MNDYLEQIDKLVDSLVTRDTHRGSVNRVRLQAKEALLNILTDAQREARLDELQETKSFGSPTEYIDKRISTLEHELKNSPPN